jgi:hypothetical protein
MSTAASAGPARVEAGTISVLRLYDVANAIDLTRAEREAASGTATRIQLVHTKPKAVSFGVPPLEIVLERIEISSPLALAADVTARIYDFGAVTLAFRFRAEGLAWEEFVDLVDRVDTALEGRAPWSSPLHRVCSLIATALDRPTPISVEEDYLLVAVHRFDRPMTAERVVSELDLVPLLSGERQPLSKPARDELLRNTFSYYVDDLVALTWDRAFLVDPRVDSDVADVLEVANAQLLELRYYDALLDEELPRMYERVLGARRALRVLGLRRYATLAREIHTRVAEVTEITERVDNALVVTEDVYLARIYGAALELFRVRAWSAGVERKLAIMRDTYSALYDDAATMRAEYLEIAVVLLIVLEIVLALVLKS